MLLNVYKVAQHPSFYILFLFLEQFPGLLDSLLFQEGANLSSVSVSKVTFIIPTYYLANYFPGILSHS